MIRSAVIVEGYGLDLTEDISTDFTYSIQDIREPDKRRTDFSKTIVVPGTARNNALFAHIFDINVENDYDPALPNIGYNFNPNRAAKAVVLVDGVEVFRGVIRVLKVVNDRGAVTYETNVLGRLADILYQFGDSKLADIDFSDLDHNVSISHLQNVWYNPGGYPYAYPLIDYGLTKDGVNYPISNFAPAIYVKEYIDRMFSDAGFTYNCPFFGMPYFQGLIIPSTEKVEFTQSATSALFLDVYSQRREASNGRVGEWREVFNIWAPNGDGYYLDKYGLVHVGGTEGQSNKIVFNRDIETSVQFIMVYQTSNKDEILNVRLNNEAIWSERAGLPIRFDRTKVIEIPKRQFRAGDILTLSIDMPPGKWMRFYSSTRVRMPSPTDTSSYPLDEGARVVMNDFVSKSVTKKDFFKSIINMHHLFVFTDPDNEKNLFVVPQTWFYNTFAGDAVDWTYKVDYSKQIELIPMGELTSKEFNFLYKKDSDYWNDDRYYKIYNEVYGQKKYTAENEFEKDSQTIELIFSPTPSVQATTNKRVIPHIYKVDKDFTKKRDTFNIRVLQYGGMIFSYANDGITYASWNVVDSTNTVLGSFVTYPYAGMLDSPVSPSRDLCFGPPRELFFSWSGAYPDCGLYRYYWEPFIMEITNKDSKLWRGYLRLTAIDINQLDFKRLVKIDNTYFKLNKIDQYKALADDVTRVELFKTAIQVDIIKPGFLLWSDEGYLLHSDESPARIPYA